MMTNARANRWSRWWAEHAANWREMPRWHRGASTLALVMIIGGFVLELTVKPHLIGNVTLFVGIIVNVAMVWSPYRLNMNRQASGGRCEPTNQ